MKLSIKSILPILSILLLIILLVGCVGIFAPTSTEKVTIRGRIVIIRRSATTMVKDVYGYIPVPNAVVYLVDSEGVVHTTTTDENGYYVFTNVAPGTGYEITAIAMVDGKRIIYRDFVEEVVAGEDYDAGMAEPVPEEPEPEPELDPEPEPECEPPVYPPPLFPIIIVTYDGAVN